VGRKLDERERREWKVEKGVEGKGAGGGGGEEWRGGDEKDVGEWGG